jgi:hypothetical protein
MFQRHEDPGRDKAIYRYAVRHDYFAELEQLAWKRGEDAAGIEAGDIARLLLRAYKAESDDPEEGDRAQRFHQLDLPRWRNRPIGGPA